MFVALFELLMYLGIEITERQGLDHLPAFARVALFLGGVIAALVVAAAIILLMALVEGIALGVAS